VIGNVYYLTADGTGGAKWALANAGSTSTSTGLLGIARSNKTTPDLLLQGHGAFGSWNFGSVGLPVGGVIYLSSSTPGGLTSVRPSATGHVVRIVGYFVEANDRSIYFNPDSTYIVR
jgi:hypothetical protein